MTLLIACEALAFRLAFTNLGLLFRLCILFWNLFFFFFLFAEEEEEPFFHHMHTLFVAYNPLYRLEFLK